MRPFVYITIVNSMGVLVFKDLLPNKLGISFTKDK